MKNSPPKLPLMLFRWFCHKDHREELEGDLVEQFDLWVEKDGVEMARKKFNIEVLMLLRPSVILSQRPLLSKIISDMKTVHWAKLISFNLLVAILALIPFAPGPFNNVVMTLSLLTIATGFFGLLLIPIGIIWLIQEIRSRNAYYLAIAATVVGAIFSGLTIFLVFHDRGMLAGFTVLTIAALLLLLIIRGVSKLKQERTSFNPTPLYLLTIPAVAFIVQLYAVQPVATVGRDHAIERSNSLIIAIEEYRMVNGFYPETLDELAMSIPKPGVMGIPGFSYENYGDDYSIYFVQHQHFGATREVVMYNSNNQHRVKGHFASFDANAKHWKYYWLD